MKNRMIRWLVLMLALVMISPLAACGRKGPPELPKDSKYPRDYPSE